MFDPGLVSFLYLLVLGKEDVPDEDVEDEDAEGEVEIEEGEEGEAAKEEEKKRNWQWREEGVRRFMLRHYKILAPYRRFFPPRFGVFFRRNHSKAFPPIAGKKVWKSIFRRFTKRRREPQNAAKKATDILKYSCISAF